MNPIHHPYVTGDGYCMEACEFEWNTSGYGVSVVRDVDRETRQPLSDDWRIQLTFIRQGWNDKSQVWDEWDYHGSGPVFIPKELDAFKQALEHAATLLRELSA